MSPNRISASSNSVSIKATSSNFIENQANSNHSSVHSSNASLNSSTYSMNDSKLNRNPSSAYLRKLINENSPRKASDASPFHPPPETTGIKEAIASNTSSLVGFSTALLNTNESDLKEFSGSSVSSHDDQNDSLENQYSLASPQKEKETDVSKSTPSGLSFQHMSNQANSSSEVASSSHRNSSFSPQSNYVYQDSNKTSSLKTPTSSLAKKNPQSVTQSKDKYSSNSDKEKRKPWYSVSEPAFIL